MRSRVSVSPEGALRLLDAQGTFTGNYTCSASNRYGADSVMHQLLIISKGVPHGNGVSVEFKNI